MRHIILQSMAALALSGALGGSAFAQSSEQSYAPGVQASERQDPSRSRLLTDHGSAITLGLGSTNFVSQSTRDLTDGPGAYLDMRAAYGTRSYLGVEGAYTLSARGLSESRFPPNTPSLFGHGFEALGRVNLPMHSGRLFYSLFAVAGVGWTAFVRTEEDADHMLIARKTDHVGTIPVGLGLAMSYGRLYGEARAMYRPAFGSDNLTKVTGGAANLQAWTAGLAAGVEF